ncbi:MAG TPA: MYXO-CTERM sorting domain-containing protein [Enhygromyxa sp.]|nr:MYXO-CTERM sorting domain-containing protein [Enhygromyxa sp.]
MRSLPFPALSLPLLLAGLLVAPGDAAAVPAFPGAQGFGSVATGGRGGQVLIVTTLAADGPGSLQAALDTPGPRIIVFAVSGVIEADLLEINHSDVTIAGQSAPGAGITIQGRLYGAYDTDVQNIIVRHIRVVPGPAEGNGQQFDGVQFSRNSRVILDHVTVANGVDENVDLYEARDVTVQWSVIAFAATDGHPEGEHNYGLINGPDGLRASVHHNLFAHNKNRNPAIANGPANIVNNVVHDPRHGFVHHNPASGPFEIVGNYYKRGEEDDLFPFFFDDENEGGAADLGYWMDDNYVDDPGVFVGSVDNPWTEPFAHPSFEYLYLDESYRSDTPYDFAGESPFEDWVAVGAEPSEQAYDRVLDCAGAFPRDIVTLRAVDQTEDGSGGWGGYYPADLLDGLSPGSAPADADQDGMPDSWESEHGLDPNDGDDHSTVMDSGYTAIEEYLNQRADELVGVDCGGVEPGDGDGDGDPTGDGDGDPTGDGDGDPTGDGDGDPTGDGDGDPTGETGDEAGVDESADGCSCATDRSTPTGFGLLALLGLLGLRRRQG